MSFNFQHLKKLQSVFVCFLLCCYSIQNARASSLPETITKLDVNNANTFSEMEEVIECLNKCSFEAIKANKFTYSVQKGILSKSGEIISRLLELQKDQGEGHKETVRKLFMTNRGIIKNILMTNNKIINDIRERHLDQMVDPFTFFVSSAWQHPQYLISLSSYWLGWNGYYSSQFFEKTDPFRTELIEEGIDGFSRAFIDFKEDEITTKSLFGRAICYRELKEYEKAIHDLKSVKDKIDKDNSLYLRCESEEAFISYETGNFAYSLRKISKIREDFSADTIPKDIEYGLNGLRAKVLLGILQREGERNQKAGKEPSKEILSSFIEFRNLAERNNDLRDDLYQYVHEHAGMFDYSNYAELGPIGTVAIGDWFFYKDNFDKALVYYLRLKSSDAAVLGNRMESAWFRTAYIYCKKKQWLDAIPLLETLIIKYPKSPSIKQTAHLYYVAASNIYRNNSSENNYAKFIKSAKYYLQCCGTCPDQSEVHFQLGKYYHSLGKTEAALSEYRQVKADSPNYGLAIYHILQFNMRDLEFFIKRRGGRSEKAEDLFRESVTLLNQFKDLKTKNKEAVNLKTLEPHMIILQAKICHYGPDKTGDNCLKVLDGFESSFPNEKKLCASAAALRIERYHELRMQNKIEEEIERSINASTVDDEIYVLYLDLANRFYHESNILRGKGEKDLASYSESTALSIFRKLYPVSVSNPLLNQYTDSIQLRMADIYINKNQLTPAMKVVQDILEKNPQSANAIYNLALIYEKKEQWENALVTWRKFSGGVKAGTYHWLESRYRTANALNKLGETEKACAVITMTIVLHPDLGGDGLREKILSLKKEICSGH